jgi:hypothetical protein
MMDPKHCGARNELVACNWLLGEGYEVFRNVSPHGLVDVIAVRGTETLLLDVKSGTNPRLSQEQLAIGVRLLYVHKDDSCEIVRSSAPLPPTARLCQHCGKEFSARNAKFCSEPCRTAPSTRLCKHCGQQFQSTHRATLFCSSCHTARHRRKTEAVFDGAAL